MGAIKGDTYVSTPSDRTLRKRLALHVEARAILSVAALAGSSLHVKKTPPRYAAIAKTLAFHIRDEHKAVDLADEIYNDANGPDEWAVDSEELALSRCNSTIDLLRADLGMEMF